MIFFQITMTTALADRSSLQHNEYIFLKITDPDLSAVLPYLVMCQIIACVGGG